MSFYKSDYLYHHGILGQRWGRRNGPAYPLDAQDHSASEKKAGWKKSLDKSSEKELDYPDQRLYSTQVATAYMYLLWGEYKKLLPASDAPENAFAGFASFTSR